MSKYGSSIYKRKDGRWEGRYVVGYKIIVRFINQFMQKA